MPPQPPHAAGAPAPPPTAADAAGGAITHPANGAFHDVRTLVAAVFPGRLADADVLDCYVLGSTVVPDSAAAGSHLNVVVVVIQDSAPPPGGSWQDHLWLREHGWIADPSGPEAYRGFKRDQARSAGWDVWVFTAASFQQLLAEGAPFAVGCLSFDAGGSAVWRRTAEFELRCPRRRLTEAFCAVSRFLFHRAKAEFPGCTQPAAATALVKPTSDVHFCNDWVEVETVAPGMDCYCLRGVLSLDEQAALSELIRARDRTNWESLPVCMNPTPKTLQFAQPGGNLETAPSLTFDCRATPTTVATEAVRRVAEMLSRRGLVLAGRPPAEPISFSLAVIRYPSPTGRFPRHIDHCNDGTAVFLFSLGCAAHFRVQTPSLEGAGSSAPRYTDVEMRSGDAVVFDPSSRAAIAHEVAGIGGEESCPPALGDMFDDMRRFRFGVQCRVRFRPPAGDDRGGRAKAGASGPRTEAWDVYKSKQSLYHALQDLENLAQLLRHGRIIDCAASHPAKQTLLAVDSDDWEHYLEVFEPLHAAAAHEVEKAWAEGDGDEDDGQFDVRGLAMLG